MKEGIYCIVSKNWLSTNNFVGEHLIIDRSNLQSITVKELKVKYFMPERRKIDLDQSKFVQQTGINLNKFKTELENKLSKYYQNYNLNESFWDFVDENVKVIFNMELKIKINNKENSLNFAKYTNKKQATNHNPFTQSIAFTFSLFVQLVKFISNSFVVDLITVEHHYFDENPNMMMFYGFIYSMQIEDKSKLNLMPILGGGISKEDAHYYDLKIWQEGLRLLERIKQAEKGSTGVLRKHLLKKEYHERKEEAIELNLPYLYSLISRNVLPTQIMSDLLHFLFSTKDRDKPRKKLTLNDKNATLLLHFMYITNEIAL